MSSVPSGAPSSSDPEFDELLEVAVLKLQAGESLPWEEWDLARAPHAERLRRLLPALRALVSARSRSHADGSVASWKPGQDLVLEDFQIEREIGRGGMGIVYSATQLSMGRPVAVKVLPLTPLFRQSQLARFLNEVRAAALLEHPHIVPIYSVGEEGGVHYYVMRLISGMTLAEWIRSPAHWSIRIDWRQRADFIRQAADALHYAHQEGVIHRDIKPSNLLVSEGHLWVADFGLARVDGAEHVTQTGDFMGTLRYASPEQASGKLLIVDHRTDVYSLGASLYELLTSEPVVPDGDRSWMLNQVLEREPRRPRSVRPDVPVDLETIALKSLAKNPTDRYATAGDLADDLRRYLADQPIHASRPTVLDRMSKWSRRHRGIVAITTIALAIVAILSSVFSVLIWSKNQQTLSALSKATLQTREAEFQTARMAVQRGLALCEERHVGRGLAWLAYALAKCPKDEQETLHVIRANLGSWMTQVHPLKAFFATASPISDLALMRDGERLLTCGPEDRVAIRDVQTGETNEQLDVGLPREHLRSMALHPTRPVVAVASQKGRIAVVDLSTGQIEMTMQHEAESVLIITFSRDGRRLLSRSPNEVDVWSMADGASLGRVQNRRSHFLSAAFSADGETLLTSSVGEQTINQWELPGGAPRNALTTLVEAPCWDMLWMKDGRWLTLSCAGRYCIRFWDNERKLFSDVQLPHLADPRCLRVDPHSDRIATGSEDRTARLWAWPSGEPIGAIFDHPEPPSRVDLTANGARLATVCARGRMSEVRIFDVAEGNVIPTNVKDMQRDSDFVLLDEDLIIRNLRGELEQRALPTGEVLRTLPGAVEHFAATRDGTRLIRTTQNEISCDDLRSSSRIWTTKHGLSFDRVIVSPAQTRVLALGPKSLLIDADNGHVLREIRVPGIARNGVAAFSPDDQRFVTGGDRKTVEVWDGRTGEAVASGPTTEERICDLCWPGGPLGILIGTIDGRISFFDAKTVTPSRRATQLPIQFKEMNFHPEGKFALAIAGNGHARFFDTATGWAIGPPLSHFGIIKSPQYSRDGRSVVTYGEREVIRRWHVPSPQQESVQEIIGWIQAATGLSLEEGELLRHLNPAEWADAVAALRR